MRRTVRACTKKSVVEEGDNGTVPRKRARPANLYRKTEHAVIERRRREKINDRLLCLQHEVPACREQALAYFEKGGKGITDGATRTDLVLEKLCILSHTVGTLPTLTRLYFPAEEGGGSLPCAVCVRADSPGEHARQPMACRLRA